MLHELIRHFYGGHRTERDLLEQEYVRKVLCFVVVRVYVEDCRKAGFPGQQLRYGGYVKFMERCRRNFQATVTSL